tara:strand:- start:519 stop:965 length:447 start_codon:yes stop_codon:yes gene_type:complete
MSETTELPKFKNPYYSNRETNQITADMLLGEDYSRVVINPPTEEGLRNADYDEIIETFGKDTIEARTVELEDIHHKNKEFAKEIEDAKKDRGKQEMLFNAKMEAFEIELIKNSENKELKKLLRKATTLIEIQAFSTIIIQESLKQNAE